MCGGKATLDLVAEYTAELFEKYERLKAGDTSTPFWDVVVLCCTCDAQVEAAFRRCLSQHVLPPSASYRVLADPPGPKVECGGATLHVLETLRQEYGDRLDTLRVMVIHAGGFSKRLIQHAVLGKIFSPLPVGERGFSMLELKLVMYMPYAGLLPAGLFVTGCDDIQLAWLPPRLPDGLFVKETTGFVALSHPAPISVAVNHGVYVLPSDERRGDDYLYTSPCEEVLQKPSEQLIRDRGAVFIEDGEETVHIDGAFWISPPAQRRLEELYPRLRPITEELSAFRDWLPCMGRRRPTHYETELAPRLAAGSARALSFEWLRDVELRVLVVSRSLFFHLGTVAEYAEHLVAGGGLSRALRLRRRCCALGPPQPAVVVRSVLSPQTRLPADALAEFCRLEGAVEAGAGALLSHCHVVGPARLPARVLLHAAAVTWRGRRRHVALALGVGDGVKALPARLLGRPVAAAAGALWSARLYPAADSAAEACAATLRMLEEPPYRADDALWSMADVMEHRDPLAMLEFRTQIEKEVDAAAAAGGDSG